MNLSQFIHSSVDGHLNYLQFWILWLNLSQTFLYKSSYGYVLLFTFNCCCLETFVCLGFYTNVNGVKFGLVSVPFSGC